MTTSMLARDAESAGDSDHEGDFRVFDPKEIAHLLEQLRDSNVPVILTSPDGTAYTTVLTTCDANTGHVCFSADEQHGQPARLVNAEDVAAVAYLDSIKVQFEVPRMVLVRSTHECALQTGWPRTLYRFQRRSSFRVKTLDRTSPAASFRHPSIPDMLLSLRIIDVSIGGCSLLQPADTPPLQPGTRIPNVHVDLDADTRFTAGIQLHHVSSLHESEAHRVGCEWLQLGGSAERTLQRYIDGTQKRRRMLALGT